jgi:hypothetical protein
LYTAARCNAAFNLVSLILLVGLIQIEAQNVEEISFSVAISVRVGNSSATVFTQSIGS